MYKLRKEDLSAYLYLKDIVLSPFLEFEENVPLILVEELTTQDSFVYQIDLPITPHPSDEGRGFVYFDDLSGEPVLVNTPTYSGTPEQSNRIIVYDSLGNVLPDSEYIVDYTDCRIITGPGVEPAAIDFWWNYVSLIDEWPKYLAPKAPVVVLDIEGTDKKGFQLGAGKHVKRKCSIYIFASNQAERKDLAEVIYDGLYLKRCPLYEFPTGSILEYDGTFYGRKNNPNKEETLFSRELVANTSRLEFIDVKGRNVEIPIIAGKGLNEIMESDLNAYRYKISCKLESYVEGF